MVDIQMPQLGETVTEGTITRWFKQVGDQVAEDEPLFEVSTDKVDSEVPSPVAGTLTEILVEEGDTVEVGAVLARVGDAGEAPAPEPAAEPEPEAQQPAEPEPEPQQPETVPPAEQQPQPEQPEQQPQPEQPAASSSSGGGRAKLLSPVVRKLVNENDLDVDAIEGT